MLIAHAEQRRLFAAEIDLSRPMKENGLLRLSYVAAVSPFFRISDPVLVGEKCYANGTPVITYSDQFLRQIFVYRGPVGEDFYPGLSGQPQCYSYIYNAYARQTTDSVSVSPVGTRINFLPKRNVSPFFSASGGFVISSRDLLVDQGGKFNFSFSFGAGLELHQGKHTVTRLEYRYMHISNGDRTPQNPGVDFGDIRATIAYRR